MSTATGAAKTCNTCRETKPLDLFRRRQEARDGRDGRCKACQILKDRVVRQGQPRGTTAPPPTPAVIAARALEIRAENLRRMLDRPPGPGRRYCYEWKRIRKESAA